MARAFRPGDWRAGYYRDQTFMWATRMSSVREFFAQLYGDPNLDAEPASGGRQMGNHFSTRFLDESGQFRRSVDMANSSSDVSNVAGWMPRLLGLAYASKLYRDNPQLEDVQDGFSKRGHQRRAVLGGGERRGRAAGSDGTLCVGRRIRNLRADQRRDDQVLDLRGAARFHPRRPAWRRHPRAAWLGLHGARGGLFARCRKSAKRTQARDLPYRRADPAARALDKWQPRAIQVQRPPSLREGVRLHHPHEGMDHRAGHRRPLASRRLGGC